MRSEDATDLDGFADLIDASTIADYAQDRNFCGALGTAMVELCVHDGKFPCAKVVKRAYASTNRPRGLRDLLVRLYVGIGVEKMQQEELLWTQFPATFTLDVGRALLRDPLRQRVWTLQGLRELLIKKNSQRMAQITMESEG